MIGAYSVGTFPIGSIVQETGLAIVSLELAEATTNGNDIQPFVVLNLGNADASALSLDATLKQFIDLGFAETTAEPLLFGQKVLPSLGFATAIASGQLPIPLIRFKVGRAEGTTQALNFVPRTFLDTAVADGETLAIDLITKTTLSGNVAEAIVQGNDIVTISRLAALVAEAQAEGNNIDLRILPNLGFAEATAEAVDMGGVGLGIFPATSVVNAQDIVPKSFLDTQTGQAQADALILVPLSKLATAVASATVNGIGTDVGIGTTEAAAIASALDGDATFFIEDIPDIVVTRSADLTQAVLKVLNDEVGNVNIYRADDHRALFSKIATNQTSPYTDTGLDPTKNFKYKATFVIVGTKGGQSVEVEGGKSNPRYTIGNNTL
jgi:hypothetical protein